jgi:hypothetical protein
LMASGAVIGCGRIRWRAAAELRPGVAVFENGLIRTLRDSGGSTSCCRGKFSSPKAAGRRR